MKIHRLWLLLIAALLAPIAAAPPPVIALTVRPQILASRGDVRVEARVQRHVDNRILAIAWVSDHGTAGSTQRQLEGEHSALLHTLELPAQPSANYYFTATVVGKDGKPRGRADARIVAPEGP